MNLPRRSWWTLAGVLLLCLLGSAVTHTMLARESLRDRLQARNGDAAATLAQAMAQTPGDPATLQRVASAQFDTGHYRRLRVLREDGTVLFEREQPSRTGRVPRWFAMLLTVDPQPGEAVVSDGGNPLGRVQLWGQADDALEAIWAAWLRTAGWLAVLGMMALGLVLAAVRTSRAPRDAPRGQAKSLEAGRVVAAGDVRFPTLHHPSGGRNTLVQRLQTVFAPQAAAVETLRQQAHNDAITGLLQRRPFVAQLDAALRAEGQRGAGLVLARLRDLQRMNQRIGHEATDRVLAALGQVLQSYPRHVPGAWVGRLNGSDLALYLPAPGMAAETATALRDALRAALALVDPQADLSLGAAELQPPSSAGAALALADGALAQAEHQGSFTVATATAVPPGEAVPGEAAWREQLGDALQAQRWRLHEHAVLDAKGGLLHLDCPLHLQLQPGGDFEPSARWLPLAVRCRLMADADMAALSLALAAIERDGRPRCVKLATASLREEAFIERVRERIESAGASSARLWIDLGEDAAQHAELLRHALSVWRPLGVRTGLEHAGGRLRQLPKLPSLGLDYVKLDGALLRGVAREAPVRELARGLVDLLHGMRLQALAQSVSDRDDLAALWALGFDGATGSALR